MASFNIKFKGEDSFKSSFESTGQMGASFGNAQVIETGDYEKLSNKPQIENHTLIGNKTFKQLGIDALSVQEIEKILYFD